MGCGILSSMNRLHIFIENKSVYTPIIIFLLFVLFFYAAPEAHTLTFQGTEWQYSLIWFGNNYENETALHDNGENNNNLENGLKGAPYSFIVHGFSFSMPFRLGLNPEQSRLTFAPGLTLFGLPLNYIEEYSLVLPVEQVEAPGYQYTIFPVLDLPLRVALFQRTSGNAGLSFITSFLLPFPLVSRGTVETKDIFSYLYSNGRFFYPAFELWFSRDINPTMAFRMGCKARFPISNLWEEEPILITHRMIVSFKIGLSFFSQNNIK